MAHAVVSVLLLTKNAGPRLEKVLDAVFAQEDVDFEVLAMDSGSADGTLDLLRRPGVELHQIPSGAFSHPGTRNRIASLSHGSLLAFLTQDALPIGTRWLAELVTALADEKIAGAFGRQLAPREMRESDTYFQNYLYPREPRRMSLAHGKKYRLSDYFFSNVNSIVRRSVWQEIPFSERVVMSEDQWWARDVLRAGYDLAYVPTAEVEHANDYGALTLFKRNFDSGASLRGLDESGPLESPARFARYVGGEVVHLARNRQPHKIPAAVGRDLIRAAGMLAGANAGLIPRPARMKMSMHAYYWT